MKNSIKKITIGLLSVCMIVVSVITLNVRAEDYPITVKPGDKVKIHYAGVNLNYRGEITDTYTAEKNQLGKIIALPTDPKETGLLINPTANNGDLWGLRNDNREIIYDSDHTAPSGFPDTSKYFVDQEGKKNTYYGYVTEQTINGQVYQLVGWRVVDSVIPYRISGEDYIEQYSNYPTYEAAKPYITFEHNQMIGYTEWAKAVMERNDRYNNDGDPNTKPGPDNVLNLIAIYIPKPEDPIDFGGGEYHYDGTSKWDVNLPKLEETSSEITTNVYVNENGENIVRFTIPEGYDEDSIQFTLNDELVQLFAFHFGSAGADIEENGQPVTFGENGEYEPNKKVIHKPGTIKDKEYYDILPGDVKNFKIEIVNKSKNNYGYEEGSLDIRTPNLDFYRSSTEYPGYTQNAIDYTGSTMTAFDGQTLLNKFTPTRIKNKALFSLFGDKTESALKDDQILGDKLDTLFDEDLKIGNLNKYYLDFYNKEFSKNNSNYIPKTRIQDYTVDEIRKMFIDKEHSSMKRETNKEVAETLYNYFYNVVLGVAPAKDLPEPDSNELGSSILNQKYTVGNFMRNGNQSFENYMKENLLMITGNSNGSVDWGFQIDGLNCFNIYNNMDYGFDMGFKLEKKVGDVVVDKHIELGEFDRNDSPTFMFRLTDVNGDTYFKTMSFNEGETDHQIVFKDISYGKYTVEEIDPIRYEVLGQPILEGVLDDLKQEGFIQFVNTKVKDHDFSDSNLVVNSFTKGEDGLIQVNNDQQHHNK